MDVGRCDRTEGHSRRTQRGAFLACAALAVAAAAGPAGGQVRTPRRLERGVRTVDCNAANAECAQLAIESDTPQTLPGGAPSFFRGFGDPSVRRDPVTGGLWLGYTWPHLVQIEQSGATRWIAVADIHLAHSDDRGATWSYDGPLWEATPQLDPGGSGTQGSTGHEVVNLLPAASGGWYAVHLVYFSPVDQRLYSPRVDSFQYRIAWAASPAALAAAPEAILGSAYTAAGWHADTNLGALDPSLAPCALFNEPALHEVGDTLYLAAQCEVYSGTTHRSDLSFVALFATSPAGDPRTWSWRYVGKLADHADALALGGDELMQTDLVAARDGALLAVVSPSRWDGALQADVHLGCRAVELASLDPPAFRFDGAGRPVVRAVVTASDLAEYGPSSCSYDPASLTGILLARRVFTSSEMVWSIHATGLRP